MFAQVTAPTSAVAATASPEDAAAGFALIAAAVVVGLVVTFIPAGIAVLRGHRSAFAIGLVCLLFGWSCVGWLVALIWSVGDTGRR